MPCLPNCRRFADGFPNLFVKDAVHIRNRHVAFLASFHNPGAYPVPHHPCIGCPSNPHPSLPNLTSSPQEASVCRLAAGVIFEQISIIYQLPRLFVGSFTLVLPYFPTGTAERVRILFPGCLPMQTTTRTLCSASTPQRLPTMTFSPFLGPSAAGVPASASHRSQHAVKLPSRECHCGTALGPLQAQPTSICQ